MTLDRQEVRSSRRRRSGFTVGQVGLDDGASWSPRPRRPMFPRVQTWLPSHALPDRSSCRSPLPAATTGLRSGSARCSQVRTCGSIPVKPDLHRDERADASCARRPLSPWQGDLHDDADPSSTEPRSLFVPVKGDLHAREEILCPLCGSIGGHVKSRERDVQAKGRRRTSPGTATYEPRDGDVEGPMAPITKPAARRQRRWWASRSSSSTVARAQGTSFRRSYPIGRPESSLTP